MDTAVAEDHQPSTEKNNKSWGRGRNNKNAIATATNAKNGSHANDSHGSDRKMIGTAAKTTTKQITTTIEIKFTRLIYVQYS